jgi:hypothetical protein
LIRAKTLRQDSPSFIHKKGTFVLQLLRLTFLAKLFVFAISTPASAQSLGPNDISILFPLPESIIQSSLLESQTQGRYGELLPKATYNQLPNLTAGPGALSTSLEDLKVVALRFDPCFPQEESPRKCQAQIRLIWQPLQADGNGELQAADAALHSFYFLSDQEFRAALTDLKNLKQKTGWAGETNPLDIQPRLQQEKMKGPFSTGLLEIVKRNTGAQRLSRITFMRLAGQGKMWIFGGFDIQNQKLKKMAIPRVKSFNQFIINVATGPEYFDGNLGPAPSGPDTFNTLMTRSKLLGSAEQATVKEEALSTFRIENPRLQDPNTMDCVSCHAAQPAQLWALREFRALKLDQLAEDSKYSSNYPLANTSPHPERTGLFRAFGYDGREPAISQRVINETAAALETILEGKRKN